MQFWNRRRLLATGAVAVGGLLGARGADAQVQPQAPGVLGQRNVIDTLAADGRFNRFIELVGRAGTTDQFRAGGNMTVFAPVDAAFDQTAFSRVQDLLTQGTGGSGGGTLSGASPDPVRLRAFVGYHVIPGVALTPAQLVGDRQYPTVNGAMVRVASQGGAIAVSNPAPERQSGSFGAGGLNVMPPAAVIGPEIIALNGIVYPVSQVLFP
ncbi:fasciclin domain-containing protein [Siccirubricoccus sp. G192]|uniref:fasciclin domain-containing protein n=1 Tax=Siccirubricoccus sp. G192 TaxID=2849651 RepID=UPI001C2C30D1|nr:fasciclin domain-containing protein [Siccirubricoccus sp. G192]MBV1799153.1 fasciclin domain-containing protein [Siccirubricoccus sp. G192]